MQMVVCTRRPGQVLYAETGTFLFRAGDVTMKTKLAQLRSQRGAAGGSRG